MQVGRDMHLPRHDPQSPALNYGRHLSSQLPFFEKSFAMAEALGLAASIIAIATLAYDSSKRLFEILDGIQKAPKAISEPKTDIGALQQLLKSLSSEVEGTDDADLPDRFKKYLEELKPSLEGCTNACIQFEEKISKITSHSDEKHTSFRDSVRLQFQEKEILTFRYRLASCKATLNIALTMAHL